MAYFRHTIAPVLSLFTSFSTLLCCALPALFVTIGAGAALAGVVSAIPQLVWLSEHKTYLFIFSGVMLTFSGILRYISRNAPCPADPLKAKACGRARTLSGYIYFGSVAIFAIGFFFAYIAIYIL